MTTVNMRFDWFIRVQDEAPAREFFESFVCAFVLQYKKMFFVVQDSVTCTWDVYNFPLVPVPFTVD